MITILSPAKSLNPRVEIPNLETSTPRFLSKSVELVTRLKKLSAVNLSKLMSLSENLTTINAYRFANWSVEKHQEKGVPAIFMFDGDVYKGLDVHSLDAAGVNFVQNNIAILSGLYGILKPLDLILPYRLEMSTKLANSRGSNLYHFWKSNVTDCLNNLSDDVLINLASEEYFSVIDKKNLKKQIITPTFKELRNGSYKVVAFSAKKARGQMARYIVDNTISDPEELKKFDVDNYVFDANLSNDDNWVFTR